MLFYIEGKSGAEAAAALGISESALRVRLHRARAALRLRLEGKLESSLETLRPAKTLVPAVMASVLASTSAKAATTGAGAAILGTLAKLTPLKWLFLAWPLLLLAISVLPGLLLQRMQRRDELKNFRDAGGFRAKLYGQVDIGKRVAVIVILTIAAVWGCSFWLGSRFFFFVIGTLMMSEALAAARQLRIYRSPKAILTLAVTLVMSAVSLAVAAKWIPGIYLSLACILSVLPQLFGRKLQPSRMDYNLFLRASQGMLEPSALPHIPNTRLGREAMRRFARFLNERYLTINYHWTPDGLALYMPRVLSSPTSGMGIWVWAFAQTYSRITLCWNGTVLASLCDKDVAGLRKAGGLLDLPALEDCVALAVANAWRGFREGRIAETGRSLGEVADSEVFVVPPSKTRAVRWRWIFGGAMLAFSLACLGSVWLFAEELSGMTRVNLTEAQVRQFMSLVDTNHNPMVPNVFPNGISGYSQKRFEYDPSGALFNCMVLPETNLFTPYGMQVLRQETCAGSVDGFNSQLGRLALAGGWACWQDYGITPNEASNQLHHALQYRAFEFSVQNMLVSSSAWSWVDKKRWIVNRIDDYRVKQLRWLNTANSLDLVDRQELIRRILSLQTLSADPASGVHLHDWKDVRGLFFTPCFPALQDTYFAVAALEILGGLDRMDREACIKGILRVHSGKGFFESPRWTGSINEYHIDGQTRDTIAAYETLRILGGLDRVKDLEKWKFRTDRRHVEKDQVTWDEIEAWTAQQRLSKAVREHQANPSAPWRSLLEP